MTDLTLDLSRLTDAQRAALEQEAKKRGCSLEDMAALLIEERIAKRCRVIAFRRTVIPFRRHGT
ncbi:MAG: hypothetical protein P9F19_15875 [Candidatus Contendobacter sp.]|nr:hypothetical protein [Candidatus Contendobacter sp.]MDG4558850.1 hypothetical protein [Candidatus Contendobacter sp.]